ncbi:MAG: isoprenylcysteine carboxylmethyltransferase family protein [Hyphomicrobiales bacterium]
MTNVKADKPGVIAPPPLIFLAGILFGLLIDWYWSGSFWPDAGRYMVAAALIAGGFFVAILAILRFRKAGTHVEPYKPTTAIVTDGPFGLSRNPIYLAMVAVTVGTGFAFDSYWVVLMLAPVLVVMHFGVIAREERYLEAKFDDEYRRYRNTVRRWL